MPITDVPVQTSHPAFCRLQSVTGGTACVNVVEITGRIVDQIERIEVQPVTLYSAAGTGYALSNEFRLLGFFVGREKEQFVFDQWATDAEALVFFVVLRR